MEADCLSGASLCVVGNINRDIKTAPFPAGDYLFRDGETPVASIVETIGGGGANSACAAAALGARVAFLGKVGDDALGTRLAETLIRHGVHSCLARDPRCATGTSINLVFDNGSRHFVSSLANNAALAFEDLDVSVLPRYVHLARADIWFSEPMLYGGNERLFRAARACGMRVSIDLNWDPQWGLAAPAEIERRKEAVRGVLPLVHLAHGNVRELNEFAGSANLEETLARIAAWGVEAVVVHMGREGAGYYAGGTLTTEPAAPVERFANTTGSGDVLSVSMMLFDCLAIPVPEKLRRANAIAAEFIAGRRLFIPAL